MPHFEASDLVLCRLPMSHKKEARLLWVNRHYVHKMLFRMRYSVDPEQTAFGGANFDLGVHFLSMPFGRNFKLFTNITYYV